MAETITAPWVTEEVEAARPELHKVVLLNDHYNPRAFAVRVLKAEFRMGEGTAQGVMLTAHRFGSCVVAVFTKDLSEKAARATDLARKEGHPLEQTAGHLGRL